VLINIVIILYSRLSFWSLSIQRWLDTARTCGLSAAHATHRTSRVGDATSVFKSQCADHHTSAVDAVTSVHVGHLITGVDGAMSADRIICGYHAIHAGHVDNVALVIHALAFPQTHSTTTRFTRVEAVDMQDPSFVALKLSKLTFPLNSCHSDPRLCCLKEGWQQHLRSMSVLSSGRQST
jgi:hypothetical protein